MKKGKNISIRGVIPQGKKKKEMDQCRRSGQKQDERRGKKRKNQRRSEILDERPDLVRIGLKEERPSMAEDTHLHNLKKRGEEWEMLVNIGAGSKRRVRDIIKIAHWLIREASRQTLFSKSNARKQKKGNVVPRNKQTKKVIKGSLRKEE